MTKRPECFSKILSLLFAAVILFMVFPSAAAAADFTLGWNPNQEEDLSGYKIHYKEKSYGEPYDGEGADQGDSPIIVPRTSLANPDYPQYRITGLDDNKVYFFVLTAFDNADPPTESGYSNAMSNLVITHPGENFRINKTSNYTSYTISGHGLTEASIQILGNGVLLGVADTDSSGNFAIDVDLSVLNEGAVELTAKQKESTTYPVTGVYDLTNPRVSSWDLGDDEIIITFDERHMQNTDLESNYRFNPSLIFRQWGGILQYGAFAYRLSMTSIPDYEILSLEMTGITDAVGNPLMPASITINDRDEDQMADSWEVATGLDPTVPNSGADSDRDGFSNLREYQARTDPRDSASSPIAIVDSIPQPNAGVLNSARVPEDTSFAVLIASVHVIDVGAPQSIRFAVDDGELGPYSRDLGSDTMRVVEVQTGTSLNLYWVVYDRSLETSLPMAYSFEASIHLTVEVEDIAGNVLPPAHFEFNIESEEEHNLAWNNLPEFTFFEPSGTEAAYDSGVAVVSGELEGARIEYNSNEPLTPIFGPMDEIEAVAASAAEVDGVPLNLLPHTVFDTPVKVFIPIPEDSDITQIGIYYNNGVEWQPACDAYGNLLPGGEGWMVAGSRVNHPESSPPLIEIQVYHFSAAQGGIVFVRSGSNSAVATFDGGGGGGGTSCFIGTTLKKAKPGFGFHTFLWIFGNLVLLTLMIIWLCRKWNEFYNILN